MWRLLCLAAGWPLAVAREPVDHCTAIAVSPKATVDGASLVGQSADAEGGPGTSVMYVPAKDHAPGSSRPIYDEASGVQIGSIPEVAHTYAYSYTTYYGVMNEHKLAFGESTCSARITAASLAHNGTALFSNQELTKIALERCMTARCAVKLMGDLAVNHGGFYGEDTAVDAGGEALVVADVDEAWVFHILADPTGRSAIWAAQRVPDEHVAFVPNTFIIREVDFYSEDFMLSPNALEIAIQLGRWDENGPFSFAESFGLGEYSSPHYSARRLWRAYDLLAPSLRLDPSLEITPESGAYPFSVKPDRLLGLEDVFRVYRDYYEGTPFSLVADTPAAGPFNSPLRVAAGSEEGKVPTGAWERPISIYRTNFAVLSACHPQGHGVVWFAPHTPHASIFVPVWTSAAPEVARPYVVDVTKSVDRSSLWWAANAVSNWAYGSMFNLAILDVRAAQEEWEPRARDLAARLRTAEPKEHTRLLAEFASEALAGWWDLFWSLMGKYNDGYVVTHGADGTVTSTAVGYPSWWLKAVDFDRAVDAPSTSFSNLKARMAAAAAKMAEIDAARKKPAAVAARRSEVVVV